MEPKLKRSRWLGMRWAWAAEVVVKISSRVFSVRSEGMVVVWMTWRRMWKQVAGASASAEAEGVEVEREMSSMARGSSAAKGSVVEAEDAVVVAVEGATEWSEGAIERSGVTL
jgi:hypothetical protein